MMGCGLLAEMKAKQERRAHKVGSDDFYSVTSVQYPHIQAAQQEVPTHTLTCSGTCICRLASAAVSIWT